VLLTMFEPIFDLGVIGSSFFSSKFVVISPMCVFLALCFFLYHLALNFLLEMLFNSNPQSWWMWLTFIKRMNNIHILNN
jgi:hypothetical protein